MKEQEIRAKYDLICSNLADRRLKPAFDHIGKLISEYGLGLYYDEYRNLEETYQFMLKYTVEGITDPERQKVYRKLIVSVFNLADKINEAILLKHSISIEYDKKRSFKDTFAANIEAFRAELSNFRLREEALTDNSRGDSPTVTKNLQQTVSKLFYNLWFSENLVPEETDQWRDVLFNNDVPVPYRSFMISALILSIQHFFDSEKFVLLFEAYNEEEAEVNQRALVGILLSVYKYDNRLSYHPEITGRLKILNESQQFKSNLERIILQLIRSKDTEKLQQRIRDEILPEMIKISPNMKNKINLESLMEEGISEDKNPDWEEIFKDSPGLLNKMEEFSELQMKGDDVFMGSFAMLKSYPFFSEMANWFMPFFPENPEIADTLDMPDQNSTSLVEAIGKAPILCNSDKYSFCFSIQRLPKENVEFMMQAMNSEMEQIKELHKDEALLDRGRKAEIVSNQYIQDLYRFYKLFPKKGDFEDIFNWRFDFYNKYALNEILKEDQKVLRNIAEYHFAKNHFKEAAEIFSILLEKDKNGELYQKIAYCHQKRGDFSTALNHYLKAELFDSNRLWNLKKTALCYRNLKQPGKALEYYREAEKIDPDNLGNQLNIGQCLLELDEFDEALKCYFKVEYLAPGNTKVWRPIAWCSFLTGKREQAEKYLRKLIDDKPGRHDLMNMGHVQWSMGKRKEALEFYQKSISNEGFSEEEFIEVFEEDLPHLIKQGLDEEDVPIMLDQLRYFLEE